MFNNLNFKTKTEIVKVIKVHLSYKAYPQSYTLCNVTFIYPILISSLGILKNIKNQFHSINLQRLSIPLKVPFMILLLTALYCSEKNRKKKKE